MKTVKDIFNETLNEIALVNSSLYFEKNGKVIRFSDHKANPLNFLLHNEDVEGILVVYVNSGLSELQMQKNIEEIEISVNCYDVDYVYYNDEDDNIDYVKAQIERFLK